MIKKLFLQIVVVSFLMAALLVFPAWAMAEDGPPHETKSGMFIKPSSGLDIKPDTDERKNASIFSSRQMPLSDTIDISPVFGRLQQKDITSKKRSADQRALLNITFHF